MPACRALLLLALSLISACAPDDTPVTLPDRHAVDGRVSGVTGVGLVLRRGPETLAVPVNASDFRFVPQPAGSRYDVSIANPPAGQNCSVFRGDGTVPHGGVNDIRVTCAACRNGLAPLYETVRARFDPTLARWRLVDVCGDALHLRGINDQFIERYAPVNDLFTDANLQAVTVSQARSGANAVRIVWYRTAGPVDVDTDGDGVGDRFGATAAALDRRIQAIVDTGMLPILDIHDYTGGDLTGDDDDTTDADDPLNATVDGLLQPAVRAVLDRHAAYLMLNLLNEAGTCHYTADDDSDPLFGNCTADEKQRYRDAYRDALGRLRAAGVRLPVIIDAPDFGQSLAVLREVGPALLAADDLGDDPDTPTPNLVFSAHTYWYDYPYGEVDGSDGFDAMELAAHRNELRCAVGLLREDGSDCPLAANLPLILGEVASRQDGAAGASLALPYRNVLDTAVTLGIGYLYWTWFNDFDADRTLTRVSQAPRDDCEAVTPPARNNCGLYRDGTAGFDGTDLSLFGRDAVLGITDDDLLDAEPRRYRLSAAIRTPSMAARDRR